MEIAGKIALVTGAGSGVGRATALALARASAAVVVVADVDKDSGADTVAMVQELGAESWWSGCDVSSIDDQRALFDAVVRRHQTLDILHNNAGVMSGEPSWPDTPLERLQRTIAVNFAGVVFGTRCAVEVMRSRGGAIVNTASIGALGTNPFDPVYPATKAAIVSFTKSCAPLAEQEGIRVNAVLPGIIDTAMIGKTGDGTNPAEWLESKLSGVRLLDAAAIAAAVVDLMRSDGPAGQCVEIVN